MFHTVSSDPHTHTDALRGMALPTSWKPFGMRGCSELLIIRAATGAGGAPNRRHSARPQGVRGPTDKAGHHACRHVEFSRGLARGGRGTRWPGRARWAIPYGGFQIFLTLLIERFGVIRVLVWALITTTDLDRGNWTYIFEKEKRSVISKKFNP